MRFTKDNAAHFRQLSLEARSRKAQAKAQARAKAEAAIDAVLKSGFDTRANLARLEQQAREVHALVLQSLAGHARSERLLGLFKVQGMLLAQMEKLGRASEVEATPNGAKRRLEPLQRMIEADPGAVVEAVTVRGAVEATPSKVGRVRLPSAFLAANPLPEVAQESAAAVSCSGPGPGLDFEPSTGADVSLG